MSDFDLDNILATAIEDYKVTTMPRIHAAGPDAAYAVAAHRRKVRITLATIILIAVVAIPLGFYAAFGPSSAAPGPVGRSGSPSPQSTLSASASPTAEPSTEPSTDPSTSPPAVSAAAPITMDEVSNATLTMPSWKGSWCPAGKQKLTNGTLAGTKAPDGTPVSYHDLWQVVPAAFDAVGTADAVALFQCGPGDPPYAQAIALRRGSDGSIVTVAPVQTAAETILQARSNSDGTVSLLVSDRQGSDGLAASAQIPQWRTYKLSGSQFRQTGGSTSFTISSSGLTATEGDLTFTPPAGGVRKGTLKVTVHNGGTRTVSNASVIFYPQDFDNLTPGCSPAGALQDALGDLTSNVAQCQVGSLAPGASKTLTFYVSAGQGVISGSNRTLQYWATVQVLVGDQALTKQPSGGTIVLQ